MPSHEYDAATASLIAYWQRASMDFAVRNLCSRLEAMVIRYLPAGNLEQIKRDPGAHRESIHAAVVPASRSDPLADGLIARLAPSRGGRPGFLPGSGKQPGGGDPEFNVVITTRAPASQQPAARAILFVAADPTDTTHLRLGKEYREIQESLGLAPLRDQFILDPPQLALRPRDLSKALLSKTPFIVHFAGHGTAQKGLFFENDQGRTHPVNAGALAALFAQFKDTIGCAILNACHSEVAAQAIAQHIGCVIGMSHAIGDAAAIAFSVGFYQAIGAGRPPAEAYEFGRIQIMLQGIPDHLIPILIRAV